MKRKGFTIVELLVAIVIIILLSIAAWAYIIYTIQQSNDTKRRVDLENLKKAMDVFYVENQVYPCGAIDDIGITNPGGTEDSSVVCPADTYDKDEDGFLNGCTRDADPSVCDGGSGNCFADPVEGFFYHDLVQSNCPSDPLNTNWHMYRYAVSADRQSYVLGTRLESDDQAGLDVNDGGYCDNIFEVGAGPKFGSISPWGGGSGWLGTTCD
jgi:type II secretory pathway pseudopilin PulG